MSAFIFTLTRTKNCIEIIESDKVKTIEDRTSDNENLVIKIFEFIVRY